MVLFHTTFLRTLTEAVGASRTHRGPPHLVFTDRPLAGHGPWVHTLDLPEGVAERFATEHQPPMLAAVRYFQVPVEIVHRAPVAVTSYESLTAHPWTEFEITLREARPDRTGAWSRVWGSRAGIAVTEAAPSPYRFAATDQQVRITLTDLFDPTRDYLLVETLQYGGKQWVLELLAGTAPAWADFPNQWSAWVWTPDVQESAMAHIVASHPALAPDVAYASRQVEKVNRIRAWRIVAEKIGMETGRDLGKIPAGSWTSVGAMPVRIAQRVGTGATAWTPPIPKPAYANPADSGRVLLASPSTDGEAHPESDGPVTRTPDPLTVGAGAPREASPATSHEPPRLTARSSARERAITGALLTTPPLGRAWAVLAVMR